MEIREEFETYFDGGYYRDYFYYACKHRTFVNGNKCTYRKQWSEDKINVAVQEVIRKIVNNPKFKTEIQKHIGNSIDTSELDRENSKWYLNYKTQCLIINYRVLRSVHQGTKRREMSYEDRKESGENLKTIPLLNVIRFKTNFVWRFYPCLAR